MMGMYDSFMLKVKCPKCGDERERECQSKALERSLAVWKKGDAIGHHEMKIIEAEIGAITHCDECGIDEDVDCFHCGSKMIEKDSTSIQLSVVVKDGKVAGVKDIKVWKR